MPATMPTISLAIARRLAVTRQRLAGTPALNIREVINDLRCLQLDPINAVAKSHFLVLFSRLGAYDVQELEHLQWKQRHIFEYWAHCASLVLTEDYPIHQGLMQSYRTGDTPNRSQANTWLVENAALVEHILTELRVRGPLSTKDIADRSTTTAWYSSGWTTGRTVNRIFDILWFQGVIMVAGRRGGNRLWDLAERCLPEWTPCLALDEHAVTRQAVQYALRALGVARAAHIRQHFIRGRYSNLAETLAKLVAEQIVHPVRMCTEDGQILPDIWYVHNDDLPLLEQLDAGAWLPRTTLLSPFDNLICDRARTKHLFDFEYRVEIYTPVAKRTFGYYVLPILQGDRLIGRIDPLFDRKNKRLVINEIYTEDGVQFAGSVKEDILGAIEHLAAFIGAHDIDIKHK